MTGGWFVSSCHGELGARAGAAGRVAPFFGGRGRIGFGLGRACVLADCAIALDGRAATKAIAVAAKISATAVAIRICGRTPF